MAGGWSGAPGARMTVGGAGGAGDGAGEPIGEGPTGVVLGEALVPGQGIEQARDVAPGRVDALELDLNGRPVRVGGQAPVDGIRGVPPVGGGSSRSAAVNSLSACVDSGFRGAASPAGLLQPHAGVRALARSDGRDLGSAWQGQRVRAGR